MKQQDVPFVANPDTRCVPATVGMVLGYFMPEKYYTMPQLEAVCGYVDGKGSWPIQHMLALAGIGFELQWIEDFDLPAFAADPEAYLRKILKDPEALEYQLTMSNLPLEAQRTRQYLDAGLPYEFCAATKDDITSLLDDGWLVRLEVNANSLASVPDYEGHSVLVIGYDEQGFTIHNPDGTHGNTPNQQVSWPLLEQAWRDFGGSFSLYAFRFPRKAAA